MKSTLTLNDVLFTAIRIKPSPEIQLTMKYLAKASDNSRFTLNKKWHKMVLRHDVIRWMEQIAWMTKVCMVNARLSFSIPLMVTFQLHFPSRQHLPDVHNFHKAVCDSIKQGIGIDDRHYVTRDLPEEITPGIEKRLVITIGTPC